MDTKVLEDIGLTQGEIRVYIALLEEGSSTAGKILEKSNVQNSVFHFNINRLIEKGLVSYIKRGKVRVYQAADPDNFLNYIKDKESQVRKLLPELKAKQSIATEKQEAEFFEGTKGVIMLMNLLIDGAKKGDEFLFFSADVGEKNEDIQKFYKRYDIKRKDKGLVTRGVAPIKLKEIFDKRRFLQMKYASIPVPANSGVCNDKYAIISWGEKPCGILIKSKHLVQKQKDFFNAFWESL